MSERPDKGPSIQTGSLSARPEGELQEEAGAAPEKRLPKGRLQEMSKEHRLPLDITLQAYKIFEEMAIPSRRHLGWEKGKDKHFDALVNGHLEREAFESVLCRLTNVAAPQDLPMGFLESCFRSADCNASKGLDFLEFAQWYVRFAFTETVLLTEEQREIRQLARKHKLPIVNVEEYKRAFDEFDEDESGSIEFEEFQKLLYSLIKIPSHLDLPVNRIRQFWAETNVDGGGSISFEEFLIFYTRFFNKHADGDRAKHPLEVFYRALRPVPVRHAKSMG